MLCAGLERDNNSHSLFACISVADTVLYVCKVKAVLLDSGNELHVFVYAETLRCKLKAGIHAVHINALYIDRTCVLTLYCIAESELLGDCAGDIKHGAFHIVDNELCAVCCSSIVIEGNGDRHDLTAVISTGGNRNICHLCKGNGLNLYVRNCRGVNSTFRR